MCAISQREGATYLQGMAIDRASAVGRFYERIAVAFDSAECHCSGRAFRRLAELHGQIVELAIFAAAIGALRLAGRPGWASTLGAAVVLHESWRAAAWAFGRRQRGAP